MSEPILNLDGAKQSLWLVKLPSFVSDLWSEAQDDDKLGSLSITRELVKGQQITKLNVQLNTEDDSIPHEFTLEKLGSSAEGNRLLAFSYESATDQYTAAGKCTKNLVLKPRDSIEYHHLVRNRTVASNKRRVAQAVDTNVMAIRPHSSSFVIDVGNQSAMKRKAAEAGFAAITKETIVKMIFETFAMNDKMLLKDVVAHCRSSYDQVKDSDVKEVLQNFAKLHTKGPFKLFWELKTEYKDSTCAAAGTNNSSSSSTLIPPTNHS